MELTFAQQSTAFLFSFLLGVSSGLLYGILKVFRVFFCSGKVSVFIIDFIYMIIVSLSLFCFSIAYINGSVRIYLYLGCLLGFIIYRLTLGKLLWIVMYPIMRFIISISQKIQNKFKKITKKLLKIGYKILYNIIKKMRISSKDNLKSNKRVIACDEKG